MNYVLRVPLNATPEQVQRLHALQTGFARVCNALAPLVHNAIYSVSRTARLVFQHPQSPFNLARLGDKPLPLLRFADSCPVYFDRHTLSLKAGQLSMFTLDGRMRFQLALAAQDEERFHTQKLREIVLSRRRDGVYELAFLLADDKADGKADGKDAPQVDASAGTTGEIPEYIVVEEVQ